MLSFVDKYKKNVFSQFGEDGIIEEVMDRLKIEKGTVIEFGAHNGMYCSNSRALILKGWSAFLDEGDQGLYAKLVGLYRRPSTIGFNQPSHTIHDVTLAHHMITPENVNQILPANAHLLSIDVDGTDYKIWEAYKGNADVVIIEINSSLPPMSVLQGDPVRGSSFYSMLLLAERKGYHLLCHTANMIFIKDRWLALFPEIRNDIGGALDPLRDIDQWFDKAHLVK